MRGPLGGVGSPKPDFESSILFPRAKGLLMLPFEARQKEAINIYKDLERIKNSSNIHTIGNLQTVLSSAELCRTTRTTNNQCRLCQHYQQGYCHLEQAIENAKTYIRQYWSNIWKIRTQRK